MWFWKKKEVQLAPLERPPLIDQWVRQSELLWSAHDLATDADVQKEFRFKLEELTRKHRRFHMLGGVI